MKILIPTAKEMSLNNPAQHSLNISAETKLIIEKLLTYSIEELSQLYRISIEKATIEKMRIQHIASKSTKTYSAIHLFNGLMYRHIKRDHLTNHENNYIAQHVFIPSALYGFINAFDVISEHRLDFQQRLTIHTQSLKQFWRPHFDEAVQNESFLISLLSSEFEQVFSKSVRNKFIRFSFVEQKNNSLVTHSTISKKARGYFLTQLMQQQITTLSDLKQLSMPLLTYCSEKSDKNHFVYIVH